MTSSIPVPATRSVTAGAVTLASGPPITVGAISAEWTLMGADADGTAVWETFGDPIGELVVVGPDGRERRFAKSAEPTTIDLRSPEAAPPPSGLELPHAAVISASKATRTARLR